VRQSQILKELGKLKNVSASFFIKKFCGDQIGYGAYRDVYVFKHDPKYVVKIERDMKTGVFANVREWTIWEDNKDWIQLGPWLAPCLIILDTGQIMIQARAEFRDRKMYPKKVPSVLTDRKYKNFGWVRGRFCCIDYGMLIQVPFKMVNAKWWSDED
jgi:hypothetical protein